MKYHKLFFVIFILALLSIQVSIGQSAGEYRTQLLKYFQDGRINQALFISSAALQKFPDDPLFQLVGGNPEPRGILSSRVTPEQARTGREEIARFADILIGMGNLYSKAGIRLYRNVAGANPEDPLITYRLTRHLFRTGKAGGPNELLEMLATFDPSSAPETIGADIMEFRKVLEILSTGSAPEPDEFAGRFPSLSEDPALLKGMAANSLKAGECGKALEYLEKGIRIDPWDSGARRLKASAYKCLGMEDEAAASGAFADRIQGNLERLDALDHLIMSGATPEAARALEIILAESPGFRDAAQALARIYALEGKRIEAVEVYRTYLSIFPDDLKIRDLAAGLLIDEGLYDQAALLTSGWEESSAGQLAGAYQMIRGGNWSGAERVLRQVLPLNPLDPMILVQLSRCLVNQDRFDEARDFLEKGNQGNPGDKMFNAAFQEVEFEYARHLSETGRRQEAIDTYRDLVRMDPDNPEYLLNLGYEEMMNGEYGQSIAHFKKGLAIDPGQDWARSGLAHSLMNEWEFDEAIAQMEILVSKSDNPDYLLQLGSMHNQIGNTREGWALIRKAARLGQPEAARLVKDRYGEN